MFSFRKSLLCLLVTGIICACSSQQDETIPESTPSSQEVYKQQLKELKEPEGMLEKEKFYAKKAFLEEQSGLYEEAIKSFENAIQLNPSEGLYHYRSALLHRKVGDYEKAWQSAQDAMKLGANSEEIVVLIAELFHQQEKFDAGLNFLQERFLDLPESAPLLTIRGKLLLGQGDSASAIEDFKRSVEAGSQEAMVQLANLSMVTDPMKVLRIMKNYSQALDVKMWVLAQAYAFAGDYIKADSLLSLIPSPTVDQLLFLPRLYENMSMLEEARMAYREILDKDTTNQTASEELINLERKIAYLQRNRRVRNSDSVSIKKDSVISNE